MLLPGYELCLSEPSQLLIGIGDVDQSVLVTNIENPVRGTTRLLGTPSPMRGVLGCRCRGIGQAQTSRTQNGYAAVAVRTAGGWLRFRVKPCFR